MKGSFGYNLLSLCNSPGPPSPLWEVCLFSQIQANSAWWEAPHLAESRAEHPLAGRRQKQGQRRKGWWFRVLDLYSNIPQAAEHLSKSLLQQVGLLQSREPEKCFFKTFLSHERCSQIQGLTQATRFLALDKGCQAWRYGAGAIQRSCRGNPRVHRFKLLLSAAREAVINSTEHGPKAGYRHPHDVH